MERIENRTEGIEVMIVAINEIVITFELLLSIYKIDNWRHDESIQAKPNKKINEHNQWSIPRYDTLYHERNIPSKE
jgi:hypothetical protein